MLTHFVAVPKRIGEAFKKFQYVDYSLLARSSRERAGKDQESLVISDGRIEMKAKTMSSLEEGDISTVDWLAAAETAEIEIRKYHGEERADQLKAHHRNVLVISRTHDWIPARDYDKATRELVSNDPCHDLTTINQYVLDQASSRWNAEKAKASLLTQQAQLLRPSSHPTSSFSSLSSSGSGGGFTPAKRFAPYDQANRQLRPRRAEGKCFRCGAAGHLAASCSSKSTAAGIACASWSKPPGARSGLLTHSSGQSFCQHWTFHSNCRFLDHCKFIHRCCICDASDHGASVCPK